MQRSAATVPGISARFSPAFTRSRGFPASNRSRFACSRRSMVMIGARMSGWMGNRLPDPGDDNSSSMNRTTAGYFEAIGNPILRGRGITEQDTADSLHVAVINEAFARRFFGNQDPIGKHFGRLESQSSRLYEVVGVAKDARYFTSGLDKPVQPLIFLPKCSMTFRTMIRARTICRTS